MHIYQLDPNTVFKHTQLYIPAHPINSHPPRDGQLHPTYVHSCQICPNISKHISIYIQLCSNVSNYCKHRFKHIQIGVPVHPNVSNMPKCIQMHTTISNIHPNIPKCTSTMHIYFKYTPIPKHTQTYQNNSKYAKIHPGTDTPHNPQNLVSLFPWRIAARSGPTSAAWPVSRAGRPAAGGLERGEKKTRKLCLVEVPSGGPASM